MGDVVDVFDIHKEKDKQKQVRQVVSKDGFIISDTRK